MSRVLKFRCFDKQSNKFIFSDWKYGKASFWDTICNDFSQQYEQEQLFTGRKDDVDVDLYEGDIVKCLHEDLFQNIDVIGVIEYSDQQSCFMVDFPSHGCGKALSGFESVTKMGDIHQDPDLKI